MLSNKLFGYVTFILFAISLINCLGAVSKTNQFTLKQKDTNFNFVELDTVPEAITIAQLDSMINHYILFGKEDSLSIEDCIKIVRLGNTIIKYQIENTPSITSFYEKLNSVFTPIAMKKLEFGISLGMTLYSKKYNLYIGSTQHANSNYSLMAK